MVYTSQERMSVLLLILVLRNRELKIGRLSQRLNVSRSTVKHDMDMLNEELAKEGLEIVYTDHFHLVGPRSKRITLLNQEFKKYINYLINPSTNYNSYEFTCIHIIHMAFEGISIPNVILAVNALLEDLGCTLTSTSYSWYMSNIMAFVWFIIHEKDYPLDLNVVPEYDREKYGRFSKRLSEILGMPVSEDYIRQMAKLFDYTNKFAGLHEDVDLVHAETVTFTLIKKFVEEIVMAL